MTKSMNIFKPEIRPIELFLQKINTMIAITGAAGFIASVVCGKLNQLGYHDLILVDDFEKKGKSANYSTKKYKQLIDRELFPEWLLDNGKGIDWVIHLGARTDTTEFDMSVFDHLNLNYSKAVWKACAEQGIPLIYASSAATYGMGEHGYCDDHEVVSLLKPLNPYGVSKNEFDKWVLTQPNHTFWAGLKFFNVYGPNEFHKGRMASVVYHAFHQIKDTGKVKLFRSHHPQFEDGKQLRDFIYVHDVADVILFMIHNKLASGLYNLGTGEARSFLDLAKATFMAMNIPENIVFVDTPEDIRDKYQYFTQADMTKLQQAGYTKVFTSLEDGIQDYVQKHLLLGKYY